jgi:hypothetical protein
VEDPGIERFGEVDELPIVRRECFPDARSTRKHLPSIPATEAGRFLVPSPASVQFDERPALPCPWTGDHFDDGTPSTSTLLAHGPLAVAPFV